MARIARQYTQGSSIMEKRNKKHGKYIIAAFMAMLVIPTILWCAIGNLDITGMEEKRVLTDFPKAISDTYFTQIGAWYSDNAPYRSIIIAAYNKASQKPESLYRAGIKSVYANHFTPKWYRNEKNAEPYCLPFVKNNAVYGRNDWIFYAGDNAFGYYAGNNILSDSDMQEWKESYQALQKECEKRGVNLVIMVAPNKEQLYPEEMASIQVISQDKRENVFEKYMHDSGVTFLYPIKELTVAKHLGDPYYKQDTHWNEYGAYIGVKAIYDALGIFSSNADDAEISFSDYRGGDLSGMCGFASDYLTATVIYKPDVKVEIETYEDGYIEIYRSNADTENNLVMLSDSFRTAIKQYLAKDFSKATIVHRASMDNDIVVNAIKELKKGDLLLLLSVERYDADNVSAAKKALEVLKQ